MCGILGLVGLDIRAISNSVITGMKQAILYRGKDDHGTWTDEHRVYLNHTRLSIIDIKGGHQPMTDISGRYVIIYNGEIYNYIELKNEYEKRGAQFHTNSDTEIILEGFKLKGEDVCIDLNGMFAFAIWDKLKQKLFIARDRLGKKPFFWMIFNGIFFFSSVLDAFNYVPGWNKRISRSSVTLYQVMGSFIDNMTIYEDVYALPPASYAFVIPRNIQPSIHKYWQFNFFAKSRKKLSDLLEEYEHILTDAVRIRLRSDVPLAVSFSGGVDSGTIAAICYHKLHVLPKCYTIDYHTENDHSEDVMNAERVANLLGIEWEFINFDYHNKLFGDIDFAYQFYDQPCQHIVLVFLFYLYEIIKKYATVVLTGNGADELFTGYIGDELVRQKGIVLQMIRFLRPFFVGRRVSPFLRLSLPEAFAKVLKKQSHAIVKDNDTTEKVRTAFDKFADDASDCGAETALDLKMYYNLFCSTIDANYRISDISGLAAQVEVRSPYLDYRLVEFAARLPHRYKVGNIFIARKNKYLPKLHYQKYVNKFAWNDKRGLGWNMRFGNSIARNSNLILAFKNSFDAVDQIGFSTLNARNALRNRISAELYGKKCSANDSKIMMNVFMLGKWLLCKGIVN